MSLRKVTSLGSNLVSVTYLKRIQTPHSLLCCDFGGFNTFTTRWSGGRVQVWVQVWAPACHLAISPKAIPEGNRRFRRQNQRPECWWLSTFSFFKNCSRRQWKSKGPLSTFFVCLLWKRKRPPLTQHNIIWKRILFNMEPIVNNRITSSYNFPCAPRFIIWSKHFW